MSFHVELSKETVDLIFRDILIEDYKNLVRDIAQAEHNLENLEPYEFEDLVAWRRWRDAIAVVFEYYLDTDTRKAVLSETSDRQ